MDTTEFIANVTSAEDAMKQLTQWMRRLTSPETKTSHRKTRGVYTEFIVFVHVNRGTTPTLTELKHQVSDVNREAVSVRLWMRGTVAQMLDMACEGIAGGDVITVGMSKYLRTDFLPQRKQAIEK